MFAAEGARVAVTGRTKERGQKVVNLIRDTGGEAEFFELDVRSEDSVREVSDAVHDRFGTLTTLVNNAAPTVEVGTSIKRLTDVSTEEWNYVITAGLTGPVFWACKYGIPHLRAAGGGAIVNISSGQSVIGLPGFSAYSATKGAMNSLTRSIAAEEAEHNIRCNAIVVGRVVAKGRYRRRDGAGTSDSLRGAQRHRLCRNVSRFRRSRVRDGFHIDRRWWLHHQWRTPCLRRFSSMSPRPIT
jgi:NAD(P)-dependent dehydrogenase (short-subunit alcohol dehydrogenase family)